MTLKLLAKKSTIAGNEWKQRGKRKANEYSKEAKRHEREMNEERKIAEFAKKKGYEKASGEGKDEREAAQVQKTGSSGCRLSWSHNNEQQGPIGTRGRPKQLRRSFSAKNRRNQKFGIK